VARKRFDLVIRGAAAGTDSCHLHVVGDGPTRTDLERLSERLDGTVTFHGWLERGSDRWRSLYERVRFHAFLSTTENFPMNLLEAMSAGQVIVASDTPGNREVLGDAASYVPVDDPAAFHRVLAELRASPTAELEELGLRARQRVLDNFSWDRVTARYESLLRG
jgi:glycosyltransferase involved in cell wall biosynthesis